VAALVGVNGDWLSLYHKSSVLPRPSLYIKTLESEALTLARTEHDESIRRSVRKFAHICPQESTHEIISSLIFIHMLITAGSSSGHKTTTISCQQTSSPRLSAPSPFPPKALTLQHPAQASTKPSEKQPSRTPISPTPNSHKYA
jgi:hypothetical protein